jgi:DNA-binding LacI/PurR family transcriptional regulator
MSDQDELIADLLGQGLTHRRTAETVGVSTKTVQRRMADPAFSSVVSKRRRDRFGQLSGQLLTAGDMALNVLIGALVSDDEKVSLQAANLVLTHGHRYNRALDDHETERRFEAIEERLEDEAIAREALLGEGGSGGQR